LDGDGCIYHNKRIFQLSFVSKENENWEWFITGINKIYNYKFNISKRSSWCKSLNKRTHSSIARITSKKAMNFLDILYNNNPSFYLERKKQQL